MRQATFRKSMTVALRQEAYDTIKEISDQNRTSMGDWIRGALDQALAESTKKGGDEQHDH